MAIRTISNAGGDWASAATWVEGVVPTSVDDVIATGSSGNLTVTSGGTRACRSLDFGASTYTATFNLSSGTLTVGSTDANPSNVAYRQSTAMTVTGTGTLLFSSNASGVGQTITTGGKPLPGSVQIGQTTGSSSGATYSLTDAINSASATLTVSRGIFNTGNFAMALSSLNIFTTNNTRTVNLGTSAITISGQNFGAGSAASVGGLTFSGTPAVTFTAASGNFNGAGYSYGACVIGISGGNNLYGANTFSSLTFSPAAATTGSISLAANQTVTGAFTSNGNSIVNRTLIQSITPGIQYSISAGSVSLSNTDFIDIAGAGAAAPFTGTFLGDALGNSGITFTAARTLYARTASNWTVTTTWSTTSGGASAATTPLPQDSVILDANTPNGTVAGNHPRLCRTLTTTNYTGTFTWSATGVSVYGSVIFGPNTIVGGTNAWHMRGRGSHVFTPAGTWNHTSTANISSVGGTYTLTASYTQTGVFDVNYGYFDLNGKTLTCAACRGNNTGVKGFYFNGGVVNATNASVVATPWTWNFTNTDFGSSSGTINLTDTSAIDKTTQGFPPNADVNVSGGGSGVVTLPSGVSTWKSLTVNGPKTINMGDLLSKEVTNLNLNGSSSNLVTLRNVASPGTRASMSVINKPLVNFADIQDLEVRGPTMRALNSVNSGNNRGIDFRKQPDLVFF